MKQISITHDLSNIIWLCPSFAAQSTPILVCALITSCIDYCNSIFSGLPQKFLHSFHTVDRVKTKISFRTSYSCVSDSSLAYFKILHKCVRLCILLLVLSIPLLSTEHCHPSHTLWFFSTIILIIPPAHLTTIGLEFSAMFWKSQNHICNIDSLPIIKVSLSVWLCFRIYWFLTLFSFYLLIYTYFDV